jgi:hypothetical protein
MFDITAAYASLVPLPVVIDGPGQYLTRAGELARITDATSKHRFACQGTYPCGTPENWHRSGRLYFGIHSDNDIVSKVAGH